MIEVLHQTTATPVHPSDGSARSTPSLRHLPFDLPQDTNTRMLSTNLIWFPWKIAKLSARLTSLWYLKTTRTADSDKINSDGTRHKKITEKEVGKNLMWSTMNEESVPCCSSICGCYTSTWWMFNLAALWSLHIFSTRCLPLMYLCSARLVMLSRFPPWAWQVNIAWLQVRMVYRLNW